MNQYQESINIGFNLNFIMRLLDHTILTHNIEIDDLIAYSFQRGPIKVNGANVTHIKRESDFWENFAIAFIENFDPMSFADNAYGIIDSSLGGYSAGGGYVKSNIDHDLVDIILEMNQW